MHDAPNEPNAVQKIVQRAGGAILIASSIEAETGDRFTAGAVYKWAKIGIPDRYWPLLIRLADASADELMAANVEVRTVDAGAAA